MGWKPRVAGRPEKGHRLTPADPQGKDPRVEPEVWLSEPPIKLPFPMRLESSLGSRFWGALLSHMLMIMCRKKTMWKPQPFPPFQGTKI